MIKIFVTIRNRLGITKKFFEALEKHSELKRHVYVYDNLTNYKLDGHFKFFNELLESGKISQVSFLTKDSTFNAFSKAVACNVFGAQHEMDPNKDQYEFLIQIDNDIIVTPGWDRIIKEAWKDIEKYRLNNIRIVGQTPGGIKNQIQLPNSIAGKEAVMGILGGSGLWSTKTNFFRDVGFLDLKPLVGFNKKHDQNYWNLLQKASNGKSYIVGLKHKLGIHVGGMAGSVCNVLSSIHPKESGLPIKNVMNVKDKDVMEVIKFKEKEEYIDSLTFDDFYSKISIDEKATNDW